MVWRKLLKRREYTGVTQSDLEEILAKKRRRHDFSIRLNLMNGLKKSLRMCVAAAEEKSLMLYILMQHKIRELLGSKMNALQTTINFPTNFVLETKKVFPYLPPLLNNKRSLCVVESCK